MECLPKKHLNCEIECLYCHNIIHQDSTLHELPCHHVCHDSCLLEIVSAGNECPFDHSIIFNGRKRPNKKSINIEKKYFIFYLEILLIIQN